MKYRNNSYGHDPHRSYNITSGLKRGIVTHPRACTMYSSATALVLQQKQHVQHRPTQAHRVKQPSSTYGSSACSSMQRLLLHRSGISMFLRSPALSGTGDGSFRRSPLVEFGVGARFFADKTLCRRVRPAWRGRSREPRWGLGEPFRSGAY